VARVQRHVDIETPKAGDVPPHVDGAPSTIARDSAGRSRRLGVLMERQFADVSEVGDRVGRTAEQVGRKVGEVPYQASTAARSLTEQASGLVQTNPLGASITALAVGTVIGMLLPATPVEHRIIGQASERLIEQAGEAATQHLRTVGSDSSQGRQEDSLG
jgi:hypothetical protein